MASNKVTALVLASASSPEPQAIAGIPGLWSTEEPVHPGDLGLTLSELTDLLDDAGVEYERRMVKPRPKAVEPEDEGEPTVAVAGAGGGAVAPDVFAATTPATPAPALDTTGGTP